MKSPWDDEKWMRKALQLAGLAGDKGEVPVGALIVRDGKIIGRGYNLRESRNRPTAHAELLAIEQAARKLGCWRLENTRLYITLEPCLMCWGAIVLARIPEVVFGTMDAKAGVCGSVLRLHEETRFNHRPKVQSGILAEDCAALLSGFFKNLRGEKKRARQSALKKSF